MITELSLRNEKKTEAWWWVIVIHTFKKRKGLCKINYKINKISFSIRVPNNESGIST